MDKEFYYLENNEQKGPYNIGQLKTLGLKLNTLVWSEGFEDWKSLEDVEELSIIIKKLPPPPPLVKNTINEKTALTGELVKEKKKLKFWFIIKILSITILIFGFASLTAFIVTDIKTEKLKKDIYYKVDKILNGKSVVLDGDYFLTNGDLQVIDYGDVPKLNLSDRRDFIDKLSNRWWLRNNDKLYSAYTKTSGGFEVIKLIKQNDDNFYIETMLSGNMGYKKPKSSNIYRLPVRDCYQRAFEFFTKDDEHSPGAYSKGKFVDIKNFAQLSNEYFDIYEDATPEYSYSNINTEDYVVYFQKTSKHLEIIKNEEAVKKEFLIYFGIIMGIIILLLLAIISIRPVLGVKRSVTKDS